MIKLANAMLQTLLDVVHMLNPTHVWFCSDILMHKVKGSAELG